MAGAASGHRPLPMEPEGDLHRRKVICQPPGASLPMALVLLPRAEGSRSRKRRKRSAARGPGIRIVGWGSRWGAGLCGSANDSAVGLQFQRKKQQARCGGGSAAACVELRHCRWRKEKRNREMKQPRSGLIRSLRIASLIIRVAAGSAMLACATAGVRAETVTTPSGAFPSATYQGVAGNGITMFRGIRYASAPTGALRFAAPTPPAPIAGTIAATQFGSSCPQSPSAFGTASTDEDCLFLNVYVPGASVSSANSLPVMVFFHGGAFIYGEGSDYDPTAMAIEGHVVVVTINYRLGILGYLADAALSTQAPNRVSGNYGLMDQQFSLKWVQQNIGAFGGNARNVTIFGESAGGFSVCSSVVSPAAAGLFQRAITESGPCTEPLPTLAGRPSLGLFERDRHGSGDQGIAAGRPRRHRRRRR